MDGAEALLVNTRPRFEFHIQYPVEKSDVVFHPNSPAGLFVEENKDIFSSISIQCSQDIEKGFGSSGAEFNCVYLLKALLKGRSVKDISCFDILEKYLLLLRKQKPICESVQDNEPSCSEAVFAGPTLRFCESPYTPSGADLVSQWMGKVCIFAKPSCIESINWPFKDLSFALIHTGEKLKTWKHLENLKKKKFSSLKEISLIALEAVRSSSEGPFIRSIQDYQKALENEGLSHPETKKIIQELKSCPEVLAAKGCGAMGAEVIAVFFKKDKPLDFLNGYKMAAGLEDLDQGVCA